MRILIVDDDFLVRGLIREYLKDFASEFFEADTFEKGLSLIKSDQELDLIILDNRLPDGFGINLIKAAVVKTPNVIIFSSDAVEYEFREKSLLFGAKFVFVKTSPHFRLVERVSEIYYVLKG